ncbi:MAG: GNAT family N-acetyltransferase [Kangiellaceae bacterium]|nr:GNAT family N-acetyltransferase [Kangiellaceae bacterium]|tara:strand:- start:3321 stop:5045 length:1725 start_codon:yes stop_codon:yes gene_type:complete
MFNTEAVITEKFPAVTKSPKLARKILFAVLRRILHEDEIAEFLQDNQHCGPIEFVERVLEYFNVGYSLASKQRINVPTTGRSIIVSNHPIGSLDGLLLILLVSEIRNDVKIVANDMLTHLKPLAPLILPVDNMTHRSSRQSIQNIIEALNQEQAIIMFPSGEVSRTTPSGIRDRIWNSGFLRIAKATNSPIIPVHIHAKNSRLFYLASMLYRPLGTLLLVNEMFNKNHNVFPVSISEPIPYQQIGGMELPLPVKTKLVRKHLYRIGRGKKPIFRTEKPIAHPEKRQDLKRELDGAELLGETNDGKMIYLVDYRPDSRVMKELGRLRELSFRQVGEGSGNKRDNDHYDKYYRHIVLWDDEELEVVGSYRIGECAEIVRDNGLQGLYCSTLFDFSDEFVPIIENSIELGRSFVQPKYWGRRSLDYLWFGIGAYLRRNPRVKYMFGPVSISNSFPDSAKNLLTDFYSLHFGDIHHLAHAKKPYRQLNALPSVVEFGGEDYHQDFIKLKEALKHMGLSVPTLYKQYTEICDAGGVRFLDFNVDPDFGFCIDGLVLVEIGKIKQRAKARYIDSELRAVS